MKILIIIPALLLSGCAFLNDSIEAYLMKYDTNEYKIVTEIRYDAHLYKQNCQDITQSKSNAIALQNKTNFFMMFTQHLPHDRDIQTASVELDKMANAETELECPFKLAKHLYGYSDCHILIVEL